MNALDLEAIDEVIAALDDIEDDENTKVLILTGAGRAFCVGADVGALLSLYHKGDQSTRDFISRAHKVPLKLVDMEKLVIAAVNGDAVGGGCNLALASDIVIASEKARFGQVFIKIGGVPDTGGTYFLPRIVGPNKAKELFVTGEIINAAEALRLGMVNSVVPANQLESETVRLARKLAHNPPKAMGLTKTLVNRSLATGDLATMLEYEAEAQTMCLQSEEASRLIQNFLGKRRPKRTFSKNK